MSERSGYCPTCGAQLEAGNRFCEQCGAVLGVPPKTAPPPLPPILTTGFPPAGPPPLPPPSPFPHARSGVPGWAIALMIAGGAALLAGGGWLGYRILAPGLPRTGAGGPEGPSSSPPDGAYRAPDEPAEGAGSTGEEAEPLPESSPSAGSWEADTDGGPTVPPEPEPAAPVVREQPRRAEAKTAPPAPSRRPASKAPSTPSAPAPQPATAPAPPANLSPSPDPLEAASRTDRSASPPPSTTPAVVFSRTYECRRYAEFHVDPEEAMVSVDGEEIGKADRWDGMHFRKGYKFPGPGSYAVKLSLAGYRTEWIRIVVSPEAKKKTAKVELELSKE